MHLPDPPAVILVNPQLGENIGTCARAMLNFGLTEMRIVDPRDGWPNEAAIGPASGATSVLENAKIFDTVEDATADLSFVLATTARSRDLAKPVLSPAFATAKCRELAKQGAQSGIMFGRERSGLTNDEVSRADAIVTYPVNPEFSSLNIAQAVLVFGYEWFAGAQELPSGGMPESAGELAKKEDLVMLFEHLESELIASGFLNPPAKREGMIRNLRTMFTRSELRVNEVQTFRGIIKSLVRLGALREKGEIDEV